MFSCSQITPCMYDNVDAAYSDFTDKLTKVKVG